MIRVSILKILMQIKYATLVVTAFSSELYPEDLHLPPDTSYLYLPVFVFKCSLKY